MSNIEKDMGLVRKIAHQVWRRLASFSSDLEYQDLEQQAIEVYLRAEHEYKEGGRAKFSTYVSVAIQRKLNYMVDSAIQQSKFEFAHEDVIDASVGMSNEFEEVMERRSSFDAVTKQLSPIAKTLFRETYMPSSLVIREFRAREVLTRSQGKKRNEYFYLDTVVKLLLKSGLSSKAVESAKQEILQFKEIINAT